MNKSIAKKYARSIRKMLSNDDFILCVGFTHSDGSEFFITDCYFELIKGKDDKTGWYIIWTKNHGVLFYDEKDITDWESGETPIDLDKIAVLIS